jgi:hypothetical protein
MPENATPADTEIPATVIATVELTTLTDNGLTPDDIKSHLERLGELEAPDVDVEIAHPDDTPDNVGTFTHPELKVTFPVAVPRDNPTLKVETADHVFRPGDVIETSGSQHGDEYRLIVHADSQGLICYGRTHEEFSHYPAEFLEEDFGDDLENPYDLIIHPRPDAA